MVRLLEHSKRWPHALALWLLAGTWCAKHLMNGVIPGGVVRRLGCDSKDANALVECGLWDRREGGFEFHDWEAFQPSKEEVEDKRSANTSRQALWRARQKTMDELEVRDGPICGYCGIVVSRKDRQLDHITPLSKGGTNDLSNLVGACKICNASKQHLTVAEWLSSSRPGRALQSALCGHVTNALRDGPRNNPPTRPDPSEVAAAVPELEAKNGKDSVACENGCSLPLTSDPLPLTAEEASAVWHAAMRKPGGCIGAMHAVNSWRRDYETECAGVMAAVAPRHWRDALTAHSEWFWHGLDGPIMAPKPRIERRFATPAQLAKYVSTDLPVAIAWWQAKQKAQQVHA